MPLRDQPYLPLYIKDFLTDEKLIECSASSTGIYIRIMCLMHKSEFYGKILLKQKYKQTDKQVLNFASLFAKCMPYNLLEIESALLELIEENVLQVEDDFLIQKRMVKDGKLSDTRAFTGREGGKKTQKNNKNFALAKNEANTVIEYVIENEIEIINENKIKEEGTGETIKILNGFEKAAKDFLSDQFFKERFALENKIMLSEVEQRMIEFVRRLRKKENYMEQWKNINSIIKYFKNSYAKEIREREQNILANSGAWFSAGVGGATEVPKGIDFEDDNVVKW